MQESARIDAGKLYVAQAAGVSENNLYRNRKESIGKDILYLKLFETGTTQETVVLGGINKSAQNPPYQVSLIVPFKEIPDFREHISDAERIEELKRLQFLHRKKWRLGKENSPICRIVDMHIASLSQEIFDATATIDQLTILLERFHDPIATHGIVLFLPDRHRQHTR